MPRWEQKWLEVKIVWDSFASNLFSGWVDAKEVARTLATSEDYDVDTRVNALALSLPLVGDITVPLIPDHVDDESFRDSFRSLVGLCKSTIGWLFALVFGFKTFQLFKDLT